MTDGRVYVIGSAPVILPFRAGGAVLYPAEDAKGVVSAIREVEKQGAASLVLITEDAAAKAPDEVNDFEKSTVHALMVIPTRRTGKSMGMEMIRELIIQSVGVDLIAKAPSEEIGKEIKLETDTTE
jgi:V/A-type H+-transporting ATPase subunit F